MSESGDADEIIPVIYISSIISILFSLMFSFTYLIDKKWRHEFNNVKRLLFALSNCMLVESSTAMFVKKSKSGVECGLQAALLLSSLTAAFMYEAAVAVEMSSCIELLKRGESASSRRNVWRVKWYHVGTLTFVVTCAFVAVFGGYVVDNTEDGLFSSGNISCHYGFGTDYFGMMEIAVFYPAIASTLVIIVASYRSWSTTLQMIRLFIPVREHEVSIDIQAPSSAVPLTISELYDYYSRMDLYTKNTVWRMLMTPMLYIGVLIGCTALIQFGNTFESEILGLAIVKIVPALNSVLWIWTDNTVMGKWKNYFKQGIYADSKTVQYMNRTSDDGSRASGMMRSDMSSNPIRDSSLSSNPDHGSLFSPLFGSQAMRDSVQADGRPERIMSGNEGL